MTNRHTKLIFSSISLILYVTSLTQSAIIYQADQDIGSLLGAEMLVMGGASLLKGAFAEWIVWLANPLYFTAMLLFVLSKKKAKPVVGVAAALAIWFFFWQNILVSDTGEIGRIQAFSTGYWLWISSFVVLIFGINRYFLPR